MKIENGITRDEGSHVSIMLINIFYFCLYGGETHSQAQSYDFRGFFPCLFHVLAEVKSKVCRISYNKNDSFPLLFFSFFFLTFLQVLVCFLHFLLLVEVKYFL